MGKRLAILLGFLVAVFVSVGGVVWLAKHNAEPVYKGQRLSYWLRGYDSGVPNTRRWIQADEAVRAAGTNAVPVLLRVLERGERPEPKWQRLLATLEQHVGITNAQTLPSKVNRYLEVTGGFYALGSNGSCAVPKLMEIYYRNPDIDVKITALAEMGLVGPAAVPELIKIATQPSTNVNIQATACRALGEIRAEPGLTVPGLTKCLRDSKWEIRAEAADGLGYFGTDARSAVPALVKLAKEDPIVKDRALAALEKIDVVAAGNAGLKVPLRVGQK